MARPDFSEHAARRPRQAPLQQAHARSDDGMPAAIRLQIIQGHSLACAKLATRMSQQAAQQQQ